MKLLCINFLIEQKTFHEPAIKPSVLFGDLIYPAVIIAQISGRDYLILDFPCSGIFMLFDWLKKWGFGLCPLAFCFCFYFCSHSRSEEHTSELQSRENLVCRLLLEK